MDRIPHRIDPGHLVRDEFDGIKDPGNADDPWVVERLELFRKLDPLIA
jgi:hypothetical protein